MKNEEVSKLDFEGWPLPSAYLEELGRVSALWATLESFLNLCIAKLAGFNEVNDPKPFILVTHASFPQRVDILGALCEHLVGDFENLKDYKAVIAKLRGAQKLRNKFMHNGMAADPDSGRIQMGIGSARGSLKATIEPIEIADIRRATMEVHEAQLALYKLVLRREIAPRWER